jgi:hypothetical protein
MNNNVRKYPPKSNRVLVPKCQSIAPSLISTVSYFVNHMTSFIELWRCIGSSSTLRIDCLFSNELSDSFIYRKLIGQMPLQALNTHNSRIPIFQPLSLKSAGRRGWLSGTILASLVFDSTGFWVRILARAPILRDITTGGYHRRVLSRGWFPLLPQVDI